MLFLLHLFGFLYAAFGLLWVNLTNQGTDLTLPSSFKAFPEIFPESLFPVGDFETETPLFSRNYAVGAGLLLYCARYLLTHARR